MCVRKRKKRAKKEVNSHSVGDTFVLLSGRAFFRFVKAGTTWRSLVKSGANDLCAYEHDKFVGSFSRRIG